MSLALQLGYMLSVDTLAKSVGVGGRTWLIKRDAFPEVTLLSVHRLAAAAAADVVAAAMSACTGQQAAQGITNYGVERYCTVYVININM